LRMNNWYKIQPTKAKGNNAITTRAAMHQI
jgi:hypothetical protein